MTGALAQVSLATPATDGVSAFDLLFEWQRLGLGIRIGFIWLLITLGATAVLWWLVPYLRRKYFRNFRTKAIKLKTKWGEWEVYPDYDTRRIAHQAWVEIKSRKVGLPFDEDNDVVVEVYNSWYALFGVLRELAKSIPPDRLQDCDETRKVVEVLMRSLNDGLRPHLTRWQAKFRRWYDSESKEPDTNDLTPQEIQQRYPDFAELVADLKKVNHEFVEFADLLERVVKDSK